MEYGIVRQYLAVESSRIFQALPREFGVLISHL